MADPTHPLRVVSPRSARPSPRFTPRPSLLGRQAPSPTLAAQLARLASGPAPGAVYSPHPPAVPLEASAPEGETAEPSSTAAQAPAPASPPPAPSTPPSAGFWAALAALLSAAVMLAKGEASKTEGASGAGPVAALLGQLLAALVDFAAGRAELPRLVVGPEAQAPSAEGEASDEADEADEDRADEDQSDEDDDDDDQGETLNLAWVRAELEALAHRCDHTPGLDATRAHALGAIALWLRGLAQMIDRHEAESGRWFLFGLPPDMSARRPTAHLSLCPRGPRTAEDKADECKRLVDGERLARTLLGAFGEIERARASVLTVSGSARAMHGHTYDAPPTPEQLRGELTSDVLSLADALEELWNLESSLQTIASALTGEHMSEGTARHAIALGHLANP